jgi:hypothetical protein
MDLRRRCEFCNREGEFVINTPWNTRMAIYHCDSHKRDASKLQDEYLDTYHTEVFNYYLKTRKGFSEMSKVCLGYLFNVACFIMLLVIVFKTWNA